MQKPKALGESEKKAKVEEEPLDHLQMMLRFAATERPQELQLNIEWITKRLLVSNLGSYHQPAVLSNNLVLDILGSDREVNTIAMLREEIEWVIGPHGKTDYYAEGTWTRANIAKLVRADSIMRETLRLRNFPARNLHRLVMSDDVVTDGGVPLPKGTMISMLSRAMHMDEEVYDQPEKFDPFRFSRLREQQQQQINKSDKEQIGGSGGIKMFLSTGLDFLPFGHGKHACPGRYIVDFEMKMIITYLLMHYDIKFPDPVVVAESLYPPRDATVLVKRRKIAG